MTTNWGIPCSPVKIYQDIFIPAIIRKWVPRMLSLGNVQPIECGPDVACGTGVLSHAVAEIVVRSSSVMGIEISSDTLCPANEFAHGKFPNIN